MSTKILLKDLIDPAEHPGIPETLLESGISGICTDSRRLEPGNLFVALAGTQRQGYEFISDAMERGARAVLVNETASGLPASTAQCCLIPVKDARAELTKILQRFYGFPVGRPKIIGVTGTNGKTTITYLLESIFQGAQHRCGVMGTVNHRFAETIFPVGNTTPGIADNYRILAEMTTQGADYVFMEVSSHALDQKRVEGIDFAAGIFTNLTQDHLDYHKNTEEYFKAKAVLFKNLSSHAQAVINADDPYGRQLSSMTGARVVSYGVTGKADMVAQDIHIGLRQTKFTIAGMGYRIPIVTSLFGRHNVYNILAATALGLQEGLSPGHIQSGISALSSVPGRMEAVFMGQNFEVFIDYAHTPDALENTLNSIKEIHPGKLVLVFGCGGDRDKGKRPLMGQIADRLADHTIITNDNPRTEEPEDIARGIVTGFSRQQPTVILDRKEAIARALAMAPPGSIVLIAGKGHEKYQIFKNRVIPFSERKVIEELLKK